MKTDKVIHVINRHFEDTNYVCDLLDSGYFVVSIEYSDPNGWTVYHLRKTPLSVLMTKLFKKV